MKHPAFSKTIQGILLAILPHFLAKLGFKFDEAATQGLVEEVLMVLGGLWGIYGRFKAEVPLKNPLASSTLPLPLFLAAGLGSGVLGLGTGCETLSDSQRAAILNAGKLAAKIALQIGLGELSQRVNELQPYTPRLGLLIETTFSQAGSQEPEALAAQLKAHVAAVVPESLQPAVLAQLRASASASAGDLQSPPPAASPSGVWKPPAPDFRTRLAAALQ